MPKERILKLVINIPVDILGPRDTNVLYGLLGYPVVWYHTLLQVNVKVKGFEDVHGTDTRVMGCLPVLTCSKHQGAYIHVLPNT